MKAEWQSRSLGEVCRIVNGGTPATGIADYWDGDNLWITPAEMGRRDNPYVSHTTRKLTDIGLRSCSAQLVPAFSVILSSRAPIGHLVINAEPMATNQGCKGLVPGERVDCKFLFYYLRSIGSLLDDLGTGTTFKELSSSRLREVPVPLPPLPEQQRVVAILDEAFEGLAVAAANAEKNAKNAREMFDSYLNSVFEQAREDWGKRPLGLIANFQGGSQPPKSEFLQAPREGYVRLLQIRDFKSEKYVVYIPASKKNRICTQADIMIGRYGASVGQILRGKSGAYNVALIKTIPDLSVIDRDFFYFYLNSYLFQNALSMVADRSAQSGFSREDIQSFPVPLPPLLEQRKIVLRINELDGHTQALVATQKRKLEIIYDLKQSLLVKAFAGELT